MRRRLILLTAMFALSACNADSTETVDSRPQPSQANTFPETSPSEPLAPRIEDGIQVVEIEAGQLGFVPISLSLQANVPARLVFTRTTEQTCATEVKIPAFDIGRVELPLGEPVVVEFTPTDTGEFRFVCGMNMQEGSLLVHS